MSKRSVVLIFAVLVFVAGSSLYVTTGSAEPPWAPFDNTRFAPISKIGPAIGLEMVAKSPAPPAKGLTSPLKGVVAPGLPNHLFIVDQVGKIWKLDLTAPRPVTC